MKQHMAGFLPVVIAAAAIAVPFTVAARAAGGEARPTARDGFERLRSLAGRWEGTGVRAGQERVTYEEMAGGTVVLERLLESEHPDRPPMLTTYYLDGDRLMLTHYCSAGNQPRMVGRWVDGSTLRFEFLDATNLAGPGAGHIHEAVLRFHDADHFTGEWTWFQDGKPVKPEVKRFTRVVRAVPATM